MNAGGIAQRILKGPLQIPGKAPMVRMVSYMDHFMKKNNLSKGKVPPPIVSVKENFDNLRFPMDHVGRSKHDTYYIGKDVLRTHATCHQLEMLKLKEVFWICDTYRRDEIDKTHYPIFHQMDAVRVFDLKRSADNIKLVEKDLKAFLESFLEYLIRESIPNVKFRWINAYFPFTSPSFELEAFINDEWMELLGCGVIEQEIMDKVHPDKIGWAFGMGLERVCMLLYNIPDIRLFWMDEPRFNDQFPTPKCFPKTVPKQPSFVPFSSNPPCYKEISFFIKESTPSDPIENKSFDLNGVFEVMRPYEKLIENVKLIDRFYHPKFKKWSLSFKITFRAWDRNLTNEEINKVQMEIRELLVKELDIILR